jgi:hypothetical protein
MQKNFVKRFSAVGARLLAVWTMFPAFLRGMFACMDFYFDRTSGDTVKNACDPSFSSNFHLFRRPETILRNLTDIVTGGGGDCLIFNKIRPEKAAISPVRQISHSKIQKFKEAREAIPCVNEPVYPAQNIIRRYGFSVLRSLLQILRDVSLNLRDVSPNLRDISPNLRDISLNLRGVSLNLRDVSLNLRDVSPNLRRAPPGRKKGCTVPWCTVHEKTDCVHLKI